MSVQAQEDDLNTSAASQSEAPLLPASVAEVIDRSDPIVHSCPSSACITPLPVKKLNPPDSDTGTDLLPVCRICQLPGDKDDFLFSPCRCSGTMMFVHYLCLLVSSSVLWQNSKVSFFSTNSTDIFLNINFNKLKSKNKH